MKQIRKTIAWLCFFSIAMGYLESAVVIYLREIYYPGGFGFPLTPIPAALATVEFLREAATLIMLLGIGILSGRSALEKFAFFLISFAIWDLTYYLFLKIFLNWPASLSTWDILFLIPLPWVGPVWAPCLVSLTMIFLGGVIVYYCERNLKFRLSRMEWIFMIAGVLIIIYSFLYDYLQYTRQFDRPFWSVVSKEDLFREISNYIPQSFNWGLFMIGELSILTTILLLTLRLQKNHIRSRSMG